MKWKATLAICTCLFHPGNAVAAPPFTLSSGGTEIAVAAGEQAPRLVELRLRGGGAWKTSDNPDSAAGLNPHSNPDILIDHVEIAGKSVPLHWKWAQAASTHDQTHLALVYDSEFPRLRLSWE